MKDRRNSIFVRCVDITCSKDMAQAYLNGESMARNFIRNECVACPDYFTFRFYFYPKFSLYSLDNSLLFIARSIGLDKYSYYYELVDFYEVNK